MDEDMSVMSPSRLFICSAAISAAAPIPSEADASPSSNSFTLSEELTTILLNACRP